LNGDESFNGHRIHPLGTNRQNHCAELLVRYGFIVCDDPFLESILPRLILLAAERGLPAIYGFSNAVKQGGLMSYSADFFELWRQAAGYVDRILKGARPADLPIEQATKFALRINLKTAKALGLDVPPMLLATADEVIE
jgi:putative tryptophan/tyrosine transport system substrate-binding protein